MGIFQFLYNFFFGSLEWCFSFINEWFKQAAEAGFSPSNGSMIGISIFWAIVVGSNMASMTIAEVKNRNRPLHGVLGSLLPVAYPFLLYFVLPEFKIVSSEEKDLEEMVDSMGAAETVKPESELKSVAKADKKGVAPAFDTDGPVELNQQYFARIMTDELGNATGPYMFEMDDGKILEVAKISQALNGVVAVEVGQLGVDAKTIRLPYDKIRVCNLKEEWLSEADADEDYEDEDYEEPAGEAVGEQEENV